MSACPMPRPAPAVPDDRPRRVVSTMSHVPARTITDDHPRPAARSPRASVPPGGHPAVPGAAALKGVTA
ncbi:hypothetical protein STEPF1_02947 [Streptomyces sp. F-1]|nr:hypothetical protein STEPF1_02947 [Streptomyces sp. F-1]